MPIWIIISIAVFVWLCVGFFFLAYEARRPSQYLTNGEAATIIFMGLFNVAIHFGDLAGTKRWGED